MSHATVYYTPSETLDQINSGISARSIGPATVTAYLQPIPSDTRRTPGAVGAMPRTFPTGSVAQSTNAIPEASYSTYASNIDAESLARSTHAPLTKCLLRAPFTPTANSDMYHNWSAPAPAPAFAHEQAAQFVTITERPMGDQTTFNNHTRQQTKNVM